MKKRNLKTQTQTANLQPIEIVKNYNVAGTPTEIEQYESINLTDDQEQAVQKAFEEIKKTVKDSYFRVMLDVGQIICKYCYDNNPEQMRKVSRKDDDNSFKALAQKIQFGQIRSESWLYGAKHVYLFHHDIKKLERDEQEKLIHTYESLPSGHQRLIAQQPVIKDNEDKIIDKRFDYIGLALTFEGDGQKLLSYRALKEKIQEDRKRGDGTRYKKNPGLVLGSIGSAISGKKDDIGQTIDDLKAKLKDKKYKDVAEATFEETIIKITSIKTDIEKLEEKILSAKETWDNEKQALDAAVRAKKKQKATETKGEKKS
jgi:hypothetical protein